MKYTLSGDGAGSIFTIDQTTGDIHALRSLDREEKPYYTLRAQAVDIDTNRPLEPESEFVIKVQDINDNEPKFLEGPYTASVPEMSPVGKGSGGQDFAQVMIIIHTLFSLLEPHNEKVYGRSGNAAPPHLDISVSYSCRAPSIFHSFVFIQPPPPPQRENRSR